MKFALVEGIRQEATAGARGLCPGCSSSVIAKCGEIRLHHWAHLSTMVCDPCASKKRIGTVAGRTNSRSSGRKFGIAHRAVKSISPM
ncbi:competence protein CoiA family protein [Rhizobium leguminosarum]|uniref:competence protein CoiA family protein n=1 Tax=Rhizobium leguminosarum TaxID=384 RepID=UPI001FDFA7A2|nr:competence protein CoiA family protein [Rhizobium leguminosarum]